MRVGWLADFPPYTGGAELTQKEFKAAAPPGVTVVPSHHLDIPVDVDVYVVHNCFEYGQSAIPPLSRKPTLKYCHDVWPHGDASLRSFLLDYATLVFTSDPHYYWFKQSWNVGPLRHLIPPPINYQLWRQAGEEMPLDVREKDVIWYGRLHSEKGLRDAEMWAEENQRHVDFYGSGPDKILGSEYVHYAGPVGYGELFEIVPQYKTFLHLPRAREPFGRSVTEAWAAGLELVCNKRVGALWWLEEDDRKQQLETAAGDFWDLVIEVAGGWPL